MRRRGDLNGVGTTIGPLMKIDSGFATMAKDFIGLQKQGINANPTMAVHPGLAKFLKEHKAWDDKWKVSGSAS